MQSSLLRGILDRVQMVDGVEPLAHAKALFDLHTDLFLTQRFQEKEADRGVESGSVQPAWEKSLAHDRGEIALLDVEHVSHGCEGAEAPSGFTQAFSVVKPVNDTPVDLPRVVIHIESK